MKKLWALVIALLLFSEHSNAQTYSGQQSLTLPANTSESVSFSANTVSFPWLTLINTGSTSINYRTGSGTAAAINTDPSVAVGSCVIFGIGNASNIAAISPLGAGSARILQSNTQPAGCTSGQGGNIPQNYLGTDISLNTSISLAGMTLIGTVTPEPGRQYIAIMPLCPAGIVVVADDGTDTGSNCTAGKCTMTPIAGPTVANNQGGEWRSSIHQGRVRLYSQTSNCAISARQYP